MTRGRQGLTDCSKIGGGGEVGKGERRQAMRLGRIAASGEELALQVQLRDLDVAQGHADIFVAKQAHQSGKTDTEAEHL